MNKDKLNYNHIKVGNLKVEKSVLRDDEYRRMTIYSRSGDVREVKNYKNDQLDGEVRTYWPNGKLQLDGNYKKGHRSGCWRSYDEKGKLIQKESHPSSLSFK